MVVLARNTISATVEITQAYYDGPADEIYRTIWGDNIHMGIPPRLGATLHESMDHTNRVMAEAASLKPGDRVLDLGCGYGSTARFLAQHYGCRVIGTNISENELELASQRASEAGLDHLLSFEYGDFHDIEFPDDSFDVVWSQEAFLHGADKDHMLAFSKGVPDGDTILVVVNLNPFHWEEATLSLDLGALGVEAGRDFEVHDLVTGESYMWNGPYNYVRLDPSLEPAHIFRVQR
jgi:cyclopropane fatty-acyl-phospholipid synthase-like methyltransferase